MVSVGIIGLPNVGKSTLFNALLKKQQALVANYPLAILDITTILQRIAGEPASIEIQEELLQAINTLIYSFQARTDGIRYDRQASEPIYRFLSYVVNVMPDELKQRAKELFQGSQSPLLKHIQDKADR